MRIKLGLLVALVALSLVVPASNSFARHISGGAHVTAESVYVRDSQGRLVGTLFRGEHFHVVRYASNGWAYGYAYGNADKCGYIGYEPDRWIEQATDGHATNPPVRC